MNRSDASPVYCLGRCYQAPYSSTELSTPIPMRSIAKEPVVLDRILSRSPDYQRTLERLYAVPDGQTILSVLDASGLRGRGGAAYPTGAKWRVAAETSAPTKYVVANGDEGDPGSYVDRLLLEEDPHGVVAGMNACAQVIGATEGIIFVRGEYQSSIASIETAIAEANEAGVLREGFVVRVCMGAGSYVCGEETALLRGIEGLRAEAQPKPPYPAERGLFGAPTVVQNVETLAVIPWVLKTGRRPKTKAFCLSGAVRTPGVVEAVQGITLRTLLEDGGDGPAAGATFKMALVGGPMGRVVPESEFEVELSYSSLVGMGHGGIVVFDQSVSAGALAQHLYEFAASESCGNCTPCRVGTKRLAQARGRDALERLLTTLEMGSLCGFGLAVPRPIRDLLRHFPEEMPR